MSDKPRLIGVTGGIGSGKSTVCKLFEVLGHQVYYADDRAKWLMHHDSVVKAKIVELFGDDAYRDEQLNRKLISERAFKNPEVLQELNAIVHPAVAEDLRNWVVDHNTEALLFDEAALLFEIGSYKKMDATILVTAPEDLRVERVLKRDPNRTEESVRAIISQQLGDEEKRAMASYVIENDGSKSLIKQTLEVYRLLQ